MDIFEKASRVKLLLTVELKNKNGVVTQSGIISFCDLWGYDTDNLSSIYSNLESTLAKQASSGLLKKKSKDSEMTELRMAIVKHIFDIKVAEEEAAKTKLEKSTKRAKLMSLLAEKQDEGMKSMSENEIKKMIEELSD